MSEDNTSSSSAPQPQDITAILPLRLIQSEIVPPAPNRPATGSEPAIDWLLEFIGYSWIAYGASSLLIISHFPNPLSDAETQIGPIFRQVIDLSSEGTGSVASVSWSPATPSTGELAVALGNCIRLFSYTSEDTSCSSFCWSQTAILVQSTKVEAIKWTGSGDGIVSGGINVVLWRKKEISWEIAWKFKPKVPQVLVSAAWSSTGPSATAPWSKLQVGDSSSPINEASKCVLVFQGDEHSKCVQAELHHPLPVTMIQWRPSTSKPLNRDARQTLRSVLLTCCVDGTVRLWSETRDGRIRRAGKDNSDQKAPRLFFGVIAVLEVNQTLNGSLGSNVFVSWATEVEGIIATGKEARYYSHVDDVQNDNTGKCEWLIGFGPETVTTFWAIHCLDDFAPVRFPRVTLWKRQELINLKLEPSQLLVNKVCIVRNQVSGPPVLCSLVQLLPRNSLAWTQLYSPTSSSIEEDSANKCQTESLLSSCTKGILKVDGHTVKILQVAVHPYLFEVELAASLDTDGILIFWSLSTFFNSNMGVPTINPSWKLCGRTDVSDHHPKYTCLSWAPAILGEDRAILMGHADGIDCFVVNTPKNEEQKIQIHKLLTIPFTRQGQERGPTRVCSIPLPSSCNEINISSSFLLVALWVDGFLALSWEITIHCYDLHGSCCDKHMQTFESEYAGKKYCLSVDPCSSAFPAPHKDDKVTSFAVVCPEDLILSEEQMLISNNKKDACYYPYHLVTGCIDGSLKLWRSVPDQSLSSSTKWDLVGVLAVHQGPTKAISPSVCGRKVASASAADQSNSSSILHIWECVHVHDAGSFIKEDELYLDGEVVGLHWLMMGNGKLLLGVCLQNELRIYAMRRCGGQDVLKSGKPLERNVWICIAVSQTNSAICDFLWGPKGTILVVHHKYFSLFSQFLLLADEELLAACPRSLKDSLVICNGGSNKDVLTPTFSDSNICDSKESSNKVGVCQSQLPVKMNMSVDLMSTENVESCKQKHNTDTINRLWSILEIAEKVGGSLPVFHPEALLVNICSGNWKRAYVALRHLASSNVSEERYCTKKSSDVISPVPLSDYLEGLLSSHSSNKLFQWSGVSASVTSSSELQKGLSLYTSNWGYDASNTPLTSSLSRTEFSDFTEAIESLYESSSITKIEKMQALAIIDLLQEVSNPHSTSAYGSLDEPGQRFWVAVRFQQLYFVQQFGRLPLVKELVVSSELIGWAFHSDCEENLFSSLLSTEPSWEEMRSMGFGFWYTNVTQLRLKMERLARQQYMKSKDPKACTLLYIALNRLQVLTGLFKISKDEKDKPLVGFLSRNFQEEKNKVAALKNAYVLMGKHQLELAIAFFLLGGDASSAVTICAKNLGDEQLALVICHLVEGYGGPLQHNLISKILLPSALSKGDYWMASVLEWVLGNYSQAFLRMFGVQVGYNLNMPVLSSNHACFLDPSIGQYCLILTTKTSMKIFIGEHNAAALCRWAALMNATALSRCGLPLEALESLSSSVSLFGGSTQGSVMHSPNPELLTEMLKPFLNKCSSNWISDNVAFHIASHSKLDLAMHYMSNLLREHPSWAAINVAFSGAPSCYESENRDFKRLLEEFQNSLSATIVYFQQRFSLISLDLINMMVLFLHHNGLKFIGYSILHEYFPHYQPQEKSNGFDKVFLYPFPPNLLLKATEEISSIFAKYVVASCINCSRLTYLTKNSKGAKGRFPLSVSLEFSNQRLIRSLRCLQAMLQLFSRSYPTDLMKISSTVLCLFGYCIVFASAWLQRNARALVLIVKPFLTILTSGHSSYEIKMEDLNKILTEIVVMLGHDSSTIDLGAYVQMNGWMREEQNEGPMPSMLEDERWQIIGASLWVHMSKFLEHQLNTLSEKLDDSCSSRTLAMSESEDTNLELQIGLVSSTLAKLLKRVDASNDTVLLGSQDGPSQQRAQDKDFTGGIECVNISNNDIESASEILWRTCANSKAIQGAFVQENYNWLQITKQKSSNGWSNAYIRIMRECETEEASDKEDRSGSPSSAAGSPLACLSPDDHPFRSTEENDVYQKKKAVPFHNPKEIYRRNGELLEVLLDELLLSHLCINSIDQRQAALASNKKGIIFFNWEDGLPHRDKSEYIWGEADWPHDGWAGSESTPVPTCVSPGVGLGSKKGTHLGLGGATIGSGALVRPGRDLTGGGAFGIPGYAGIGASGLGWGIQEYFDEFVDPPATVDNIRTMAFSTHPSRPFFLVGSSNTHVYLWEFGKDSATATYGVLPAANVPPPYALSLCICCAV
ncbi:transducin family protein/WD-40 repeat family protein [Forsythia ovata]|uniref:Transducin family protein/WD-40 repeat family protein n=1 Tax=Forsythia ovata TaxID=205694 RepID=A0ABD1VG54_9LAMI